MEIYYTLDAQGEDIASIHHMMQCDSVMHDNVPGPVTVPVVCGFVPQHGVKGEHSYTYVCHPNAEL